MIIDLKGINCLKIGSFTGSAQLILLNTYGLYEVRSGTFYVGTWYREEELT